MPKKTDQNVILRCYILRRQGNTLDEILDALSEEFDENQIPDRSTISRHLKKYESIPPDKLAEDTPFKWSEMKEVPWEGSRMVLGAYVHYMANDGPDYIGPFTKRFAKWIWRVGYALGPQGDMSPFDLSESMFGVDIETLLHNTWKETGDITALNGVPPLPTRFDVFNIAREYSLREIHSILFPVEFDTRDLDLWLAFSPWNGPYQLSKYHKARDGFGGFQRVLWHSGEMEWLQLVDPKAAALVELNSPDEIPGLEPPNEMSEIMISALDGLLLSQLRIVGLWMEAFIKNPDMLGMKTDPWYLEYHRRLQIARVQVDENDSFKKYDLLLAEMHRELIQEELNERQRQASKQK